MSVVTIGKRGAPAKYPWKKMKVGETFKPAGIKESSFRALAYLTGKRLKRKFSVSIKKGVLVCKRTK